MYYYAVTITLVKIQLLYCNTHCSLV
jgi:hypothetical protein